MEIVEQIEVQKLPFSPSTRILIENGQLTQIYNNDDGSFVPDRGVPGVKSDYPYQAIAYVSVTGNNPNTDEAIKPHLVAVEWRYRLPGGSEKKIAVGMSGDFFVDKDTMKLHIRKNVSMSENGLELHALATWYDENDIDQTYQYTEASEKMSVAMNVVTNLGLASIKGDKTDYQYVSDGFTINPFTHPQNDAGDAWKVRCKAQLLDGVTPIVAAHNGDNKYGNAYYFWYYADRKGNLIRLEESNEWFTCEKYSDGTFDNECLVDLAKNTNVTLYCRAGYAAYGELSSIKETDGTISPSRLDKSWLKTRFSLTVQQPPILYHRVIPLVNDTLQRKQIAKLASSTHVKRRLLLFAGNGTVNEMVNPVTGKKDLVDRCYKIVWYKQDANGVRTKIGEGADLDVTLEALGATSVKSLPKLIINVQSYVEDLFGNNFCAEFDTAGDNAEVITTHGNKTFLNDLGPLLYDLATEQDGTFQSYKLTSNNLLRYATGNYAPTVGITAAQKAECDGILYTDAAKTDVAYKAGEYNAVTEWEKVDKPLMAAGGKPRTLYKADGTAVSQKVRPWETVRTDLSIGYGFPYSVYFLDNKVGKSGKKWLGIFTDITEWDGIDLTPYKLVPTALSPGAFTTIGGLARDFFYRYRPSDANAQGVAGSVIAPFNEDRAYPRHDDVSEVTSMDYCRKNNKTTTSPVPMAEGGFFCYDAYVAVVELLAGTKYLDNPETFGSGISSNDGINASTFFKYGGIKWKKAADTGYTYDVWGINRTIKVGGKTASSHWSANTNGEAPKEQCMEAQMAMSMAVELGIDPTTTSGSEKTFYFYGNKYYYMTAGINTAPKDGQLNCRLFKIVNYSFTDDTNGKTECEFRLRMSLYHGMTLAGDVFRYCGGGCELLALALQKRDTSIRGNKIIGVWMQPDQSQWKRITNISSAPATKFGFEDTYKKVFPVSDDDNVTTNGYVYVKNRAPYSPWSGDVSSRGKGDAMFVSDENWFDTNASGNYIRLALRFGRSANSGFCAPRSLNCVNPASHANRSHCGRAQALVRITQ